MLSFRVAGLSCIDEVGGLFIIVIDTLLLV